MEKMADKTEQLRTEFHASIEAMGAEMRSMFEKLMRSKDHSVEESSGSGGVSSFKARLKSVMVTGNKTFTHASKEHIDLTEIGRPHTKLAKLECPRFDGNDFKSWFLKIEQFFMMMHLEGKAL